MMNVGMVTVVVECVALEVVDLDGVALGEDFADFLDDGDVLAFSELVVADVEFLEPLVGLEGPEELVDARE